MRPLVRVKADHLNPGTVPSYSVDPSYPTLVWEGGSIGRYRVQRVILPLFELSGDDDDVREKVGEIVNELIFTAMFAGRLTLAIRSDYSMPIQSRGESERLIRVVNMGAMYGIDYDNDEPYDVSGPGIEWDAPENLMPRILPKVERLAREMVDNLTIMRVHGS